MNRTLYLSLCAQAQRRTRRADEAEDLLHDALLAALQAGRGDLNAPENQRWLSGVLRNRAALDARSALRRKARETQAAPAQPDRPTQVPDAFLNTLPHSLRTTALLALTGHTRVEIMHLLRISNPALRQRIAQIRQRWRAHTDHGDAPHPVLQGNLPFGLIRSHLHHHIRHTDARLGSHDPDGHLFVLSDAHKTAARGNTLM